MVCVVRTVLLSFAVEKASLKASITSGSTNPKIPAGFAGIADLLSVLEHSKFALNVEFFVRHQHFLHPKLGNLQEVSWESVHLYIQKWRSSEETKTKCVLNSAIGNTLACPHRVVRKR